MSFEVSSEHRRPDVVYQSVAFDRREFGLCVTHECGTKVGCIAGSVEAGALGVHQDPGSGFNEVDINRALVEQDFFECDDAVDSASLGKDQRHDPHGGVIVSRNGRLAIAEISGVTKSMLRDSQSASIVHGFDGKDWKSSLKDPRVHDAANRFTGG